MSPGLVTTDQLAVAQGGDPWPLGHMGSATLLVAQETWVLGMEYLRNQSICRVQIPDYVNTTTNLDGRHLWTWILGTRNNMSHVQILDDISINLEDTCWDPYTNTRHA